MSKTGQHTDPALEALDNTRLREKSRRDNGLYLRISRKINLLRKSSKSRNRNYEWALTNLEAAELLVGNCHYCNHKSEHKEDLESINPYNGVDRYDNNLGYTIANSVSCCRWCNRAKHIMSIDEFKSWLRAIHKHWM